MKNEFIQIELTLDAIRFYFCINFPEEWIRITHYSYFVSNFQTAWFPPYHGAYTLHTRIMSRDRSVYPTMKKKIAQVNWIWRYVFHGKTAYRKTKSNQLSVRGGICNWAIASWVQLNITRTEMTFCVFAFDWRAEPQHGMDWTIEKMSGSLNCRARRTARNKMKTKTMTTTFASTRPFREI